MHALRELIHMRCGFCCAQMRAAAALSKAKCAKLEACWEDAVQQVDFLRSELAASQEEVALYQEAELRQLPPLQP